MRITCPNCDAQYEVDERAIPENGRDVQCSNCGHAWFQLPPDIEAAMEDEEAAFGAAPAEAPAAVPPPEPPATAEPRVEAEPEPEPEESESAEAVEPGGAWPAPPAQDYEEDLEGAPEPFAAPVGPAFAPPAAMEEAEESEGEEPPLAPAPQRRGLDEHIQAVLREEAERERRAREADGGPEPRAADEPASDTAPSLPRISPSRPYAELSSEEESDGTDHPAEEDALVSHGSRRDLLPDIEQINSTLRATGQEGSAAAVAIATAATRRVDRARGFRLGFRLVLLVVILVLVLYVLAPSIAAHVPALAPPLNALVTLINSYRGWIDRLLISAVAGMNGH